MVSVVHHKSRWTREDWTSFGVRNPIRHPQADMTNSAILILIIPSFLKRLTARTLPRVLFLKQMLRTRLALRSLQDARTYFAKLATGVRRIRRKAIQNRQIKTSTSETEQPPSQGLISISLLGMKKKRAYRPRGLQLVVATNTASQNHVLRHDGNLGLRSELRLP